MTAGQRDKWTAREREAYAIVAALEMWHSRFGIHEVHVLTDHEGLE